MAAAAVRHGRNLWSGRFRARHESGEEVVRLDFDKDPAENVKEILWHIVVQHGVGKAKKLAYLNSFVKLILKVGEDRNLGLGSIEILTCLQIGLFHEAKEVRAATLRVMRHLLKAEDMIHSFLALYIDYLVMRCLDVCLENEIERMHAIKLIRQLNNVAPDKMPRSLLYPVIAVGNNGASERDRFVRISLATLCEIAFRNIDLVSQCGGVSTLLWNILDCHQFPRLNESLTSTILYLMNHPRTRHYIKANTDLEQLLAPMTDSHFRYSGDSSDQSRGDERETRFIASKMALITLMRSWPGLIRLCHPAGSGLQSLIGILYLPYTEIRKYILEMISDLFRLTLPEWTEDFPAALVSVDPSEMKDSWKLSEDFVAEEGRALLPHCAATRPNLIENHLALLLSAWVNAGLLEALIEVITSSEGALFNRAVILLGELLYMANTLLPAECYSHSQCLPSLISLASMNNISAAKRHQACLALRHLSSFHALKKRGIVPCTLFLDQLLQNAGKFTETTSKHWHLRRDKLSEYYFRKLPNDDTVLAIRNSMVLQTKDNCNWDWDLIGSVLKWPNDRLKKLEDQNYVRFLRRLVFFFKPTNHLFSHMELSSEMTNKICLASCHLVDFLVSVTQEEAEKLATELLTDVAQCLTEVATRKVVPESVFGSNSIHTTLSQYYFLIIGRFSATNVGCLYLEKTGVFQSFLEMMTGSTQDMYVKLVLSSLSYKKDGSARAVLSKALIATPPSCRMYATKLLRVLLRAGMPGFSHWCIDLLITQLYDQSRAVALVALNILDEACDIEANLKKLVEVRPSLLHLGEKGAMLLCRFLSIPTGFRSLRDANFLAGELDKWRKSFNVRYVLIVEDMLNEAYTSHEKSHHGAFTRRSLLKHAFLDQIRAVHKVLQMSANLRSVEERGPNKDVFLPFHLYGQLARHEEGIEMLKKEECLKEYFSTIRSQELHEDKDIIKLKAALWAVGHVGSSVFGMNIMEEENMVPELIRLAEECGVFSIRGTAFYVLGLVASTRRGADVLSEYGWESQCHTRREQWPVLEEHGWISETVGESGHLTNANSMSSVCGDVGRLSSMGSTHLSFIREESVRSDQNGDTVHSEFCEGGWSRPGSGSLVKENVNNASNINSNSHTYFENDLNFSGVQHLAVGVPLSRTLPEESLGFRRYQSMPVRSSSDRNLNRQDLALRQKHTKCTVSPNKPEPNHLNFVAPKVAVIKEDGVGRGIGRKPLDQGLTNFEIVSSPVIHLHSEDTHMTSDISDSKGKEPMFHIGSLGGSGCESGSSSSGAGGHKEDPSSSDSSQHSKSRANSFNTDSTTSGVSSYESAGLQSVSAGLTSLSPIPSSSSINTLSPNSPSVNITITSVPSAHGNPDHELMHPSAAQRRLFNLNRIPSYRRRSASPALGALQSPPGLSSHGFTAHRDVLGYATLRNIRRQRTYSTETDVEGGKSAADSWMEPRITRTISVDSDTSVDSNLWLSIRRNVSSSSLTDFDQQGQHLIMSGLPSFKPLSSHNRFVGLALPVDVNMMFEVIEGEDIRSTVANLKSPEQALAEKLDAVTVSVSPDIPPLMKESTYEHNSERCLLCNRLRQCCFRNDTVQGLEDIPPIDGEMDSPGKKYSDAYSSMVGEKGARSRGDSMNEQSSSATPGSQTSSATSSDTANKKLTEESNEGRSLIRLEVLRLIVNLSSSVGLKGSEQGLLSLKQRFPSTFKDVCFFSEVCLMLSSYSFRLNARRFIQELFDEIDITKLLEGPQAFLGITDDNGPRMAPIRQDSLDNFKDFS